MMFLTEVRPINYQDANGNNDTSSSSSSSTSSSLSTLSNDNVSAITLQHISQNVCGSDGPTSKLNNARVQPVKHDSSTSMEPISHRRRAITASRNFGAIGQPCDQQSKNWPLTCRQSQPDTSQTHQICLNTSDTGAPPPPQPQPLKPNQLCTQMGNLSLTTMPYNKPYNTIQTNLTTHQAHSICPMCKIDTISENSIKHALADTSKCVQWSATQHQQQSTLVRAHNQSMSVFWPEPDHSAPRSESFSRKVFVGGLPVDIDENEIVNQFKRFGLLVADWPHKSETKSYYPPKGYAFLIFQNEQSVHTLIKCCMKTDDNKYYTYVSSPTIKDKVVQVRAWCASDADYVMDPQQPLEPRRTIFVGGVPRPLKAAELGMIVHRLYGGVCYAGIDTDFELKYPKGAGRVAFSNQQSYIAAISARFVQLQHGDIDKRVEVKPYVLDDQICDECQGSRCADRFAPFFCANIMCLQYYCEACWTSVHTRLGREFHKPLVKEGTDRPRVIPFKWC